MQIICIIGKQKAVFLRWMCTPLLSVTRSYYDDDEYTNLSFILYFLLFLYICILHTPHLHHSTITDHRTQLFTTFALDTLTEIIDASVIADPKKNDKKDLLNGPVDYNKLISKAIQFFPNLKLSEGKSQPSTNEYARVL